MNFSQTTVPFLNRGCVESVGYSSIQMPINKLCEYSQCSNNIRTRHTTAISVSEFELWGMGASEAIA